MLRPPADEGCDRKSISTRNDLCSYASKMIRKGRRVLATLGAVVVFFVLAPPFSILVTSWRSREEASWLLASARMIHPGAMTETETRKALSQFDKYLFHGQESISGHPTTTRDSYSISNYPAWVTQIAPHLPPWANKHIWFLPYTSFTVSPRFQNGELVLLELKEMQEQKDGDIHPFDAIVSIFSKGGEHDDRRIPASFTGFYVSQYDEIKVDENGRQIGPSWIVREYVYLDERASPEQFASSYRFNLGCLTSLFGCQSARKILAVQE